MRTKFNIIITNRDRDKYLKKCILYLDQANQLKKYDIEIYIIQNKINICQAKNLKIKHIKIKDDQTDFNKSKYINAGYIKMRKNYDYFIQWDNDALAVPELFYLIETYGEDWTVLSGIKITESETERFFKLKKNIDIKTLQVDPNSTIENKRNCYVGMIALKEKCLKKYLEIMKISLPYNENFGHLRGEDSQLSINSTRMDTMYKIITKTVFYDCWRHLYHNNTGKPFDMLNQQSAVIYLNDCLIADEKKIKNYLGFV